MSSFSFDFNVSSSDNSEENQESICELKEILVENNVIIDSVIVECFQVVCPDCNPEILDFRVHDIGDLTFKEVIKPYEETLHRFDEECDIIPGKYEGGFKIWECSYDLARIIVDPSILRLNPKSVLELGCGHGLPGIASMMVYGDLNEIVFSDFNSEVLTDATWPNIVLNCPNIASASENSIVKCIAGDWTSLSCSIKIFDLILSAETLYTVESCRKVSNNNAYMWLYTQISMYLYKNVRADSCFFFMRKHESHIYILTYISNMYISAQIYMYIYIYSYLCIYIST
jgi:hypothetical protein